MADLPLSHIKVIDLSRVRAGPTCVKFFGDFGADVIKVERTDGEGDPMGDNRHSSDYVNAQRNKRGITLDLKRPEGVAVLKKLIETADVVVENFRPDVKFRLGIDYESLAAINPRLIYTSISAFGETGPYRTRPGFDLIAQGMGGLMWLTGYEDRGPLRVGISPADLSAGIFAAMGTMIALLERERSGKGQWVQTNLLSSQIMMLDYQA
ncbi:MAG: CaiB/BaiF CoA transferase family protein, partial [Phenylobacterium sp.]